MKRRQAINHLALATVGAVMWPACKPSSSPGVAGIDLNSGEIALVDEFATAILPVSNLPVETPESRLDFITTMLRDCTSPEERKIYEEGVREFADYIRKTFQKPFGSLASVDQETAFIHLHEDEGISMELKTFYAKTRTWSIQHFTSSEYFLNTYTDFQFVPGHFYGCVPI